MRKTRLVILPTKCLHQMGFLLLFLSCPVIGDWGRIRPETENSHNAIQIEREGTCGLERDPPGGLLGFLNENGSKQCRLSEDSDMITPTEMRVVEVPRSHLRRVDVRRVDQQRNIRLAARRVTDERTVRRTTQRLTEERRDVRRESERRVQREVRSRSVESRRTAAIKNDVRVRSLSLSRLDNERAARNQRSVPGSRNIRENSEERRERLHLNRRLNERQNDRRVDQQRRMNREMLSERRENERTARNVAERRERENERTARKVAERRERETRLTRTVLSERRDLRRDTNRRSLPDLSIRRREADMTRRQSRERTQNIPENRLSLSRRQLNEARRVERMENRRTTDRVNLERRSSEIRKARSFEQLGASERRDNNRRQIENRRLVTVSPKLTERNLSERRTGGKNERVEGLKSRRVATIRTDAKPELKLGEKHNDEEEISGGITKWMDFTNYDNFKTGDWTTNCVIGAVVYFLTTRQVKVV